MRKTKLGTKRQCQACGGRLYDLGKRPVVCPHCGAEVDLERVKRARAPNGEPTAAKLERRPPRRAAAAPDRGRRASRRAAAAMVARTGGGARQGRPLARRRRAASVPAVRLRRRRQDDARQAPRRIRVGRDRLRRLHRQGGAGDAVEGLRRRVDDSRAHLPRQRGRRRRADLHPQPRRPRLARRADRHRRMLDGRRRARPRPSVVRQADPGARRPGATAAGQGRRLLHRGRARRDADRDPSPGAGRSDHPPVGDRPLGRRDRLRPIRREPRHPPRRDRGRRRARRRSGSARRQSHPPPLQSAHPAAAGDRGAAAGRRRQARLPAQRPRQGPDQRRPLAGRNIRRDCARTSCA